MYKSIGLVLVLMLHVVLLQSVFWHVLTSTQGVIHANAAMLINICQTFLSSHLALTLHITHSGPSDYSLHAEFLYSLQRPFSAELDCLLRLVWATGSGGNRLRCVHVKQEALTQLWGNVFHFTPIYTVSYSKGPSSCWDVLVSFSAALDRTHSCARKHILNHIHR